MTEPYDPAILALEELRSSGVPVPEDLVEDLGPLALLLFTHSLVYEALSRWTTFAAEALNEDGTGPDEVTRAIQAIASACGALDVACEAMSLVPQGAGEARS